MFAVSGFRQCLLLVVSVSVCCVRWWCPLVMSVSGFRQYLLLVVSVSVCCVRWRCPLVMSTVSGFRQRLLCPLVVSVSDVCQWFPSVFAVSVGPLFCRGTICTDLDLDNRISQFLCLVYCKHPPPPPRSV